MERHYTVEFAGAKLPLFDVLGVEVAQFTRRDTGEDFNDIVVAALKPDNLTKSEGGNILRGIAHPEAADSQVAFVNHSLMLVSDDGTALSASNRVVHSKERQTSIG